MIVVPGSMPSIIRSFSNKNLFSNLHEDKKSIPLKIPPTTYEFDKDGQNRVKLFEHNCTMTVFISMSLCELQRKTIYKHLN